jgi:hypothetical protein
VAVADQQLKALLGQDARVARLLPIRGIAITKTYRLLSSPSVEARSLGCHGLTLTVE